MLAIDERVMKEENSFFLFRRMEEPFCQNLIQWKTFKVKKQLVIGEMCRTSSEYYKLQNINNKGKFLYNQQWILIVVAYSDWNVSGFCSKEILVWLKYAKISIEYANNSTAESFQQVWTYSPNV